MNRPMTRKAFCKKWNGRTNFWGLQKVKVTTRRLEIWDHRGFCVAIPFGCDHFRDVAEMVLSEKGF